MSARPFACVPGGKLLKEWREERKKIDPAFTQRAICDRIRTDQASLCAFESGRERPGLALALRIELLTGGAVRPVHWAKKSELKVSAA